MTNKLDAPESMWEVMQEQKRQNEINDCALQDSLEEFTSAYKDLRAFGLTEAEIFQKISTNIGKVKNIIKGYVSKYDIEVISFIEKDRVLYSGSYSRFQEMNYDEDKELGTLKQQILDSNCRKCLNFNNRALFVFL